jgi:hypothetical protein
MQAEWDTAGENAIREQICTEFTNVYAKGRAKNLVSG